MLTGYQPLTNYAKPIRSQASPNPSAISRLLAAAVVNKKFRELLLTDPLQALAQGYQGETFPLNWSERNLVLSIQADDLSDFAQQVNSYPEERSQRWIPAWIPEIKKALVLDAE